MHKNIRIGRIWKVLCFLVYLFFFFPITFWVFLDTSQYIFWYIEPLFSSFYLLNICVDLLKSSSTHPLIPPNRPKSSCMHFIYFSCISFFSLCVHSIWFSCFSCRSMVPCSSRSFYVSFQSVFGQVFWLFMSFDNCVKKGGEIWDLNAIPQGK